MTARDAYLAALGVPATPEVRALVDRALMDSRKANHAPVTLTQPFPTAPIEFPHRLRDCPFNQETPR